MPADAARLIGEQLANVVGASGGKKGFGLLLALAIAIYGVMKGASALIISLNIAYDENETRSFVRLNLIALAMAAGAVFVAILAMVSITALAAFEALFPAAPGYVTFLGQILSYGLMGGIGAALAATVYRYGPDRRDARWAWLSPGSLFTSICWMAITFGFGIYVANFGNYDATYGSLGAAMVLLTWLYLSAYVLLLGAELNCELEKQTDLDTTIGAERPLGSRGAYAADTVVEGSDAEPEAGPGPKSALLGAKDDRSEPKHVEVSHRSSAVKHFVVSKAVSRAQKAAGFGGIGFLSSTLASSGLVMLRKRDGLAKGAALLAAAGALSLVRRDREDRDGVA